MIDQQAHVVQFNFAPDFIGQIVVVIFVFHDLHAFFDAGIIKADTFTRRMLEGLPVAAFKICFCALAGAAKQAVMLVKTVQNRTRDIERDLGG